MLLSIRSWNNGRHIFRSTNALLRRQKHKQESFLNPSSGQYLEQLYNEWLKDPKSVETSWDQYFRRKPTENTTTSNNLNLQHETLDIDATIRAYQVMEKHHLLFFFHLDNKF